MTGLDAYLNEVVSKTDLAYSIDTIGGRVFQISMAILRLSIIILITNFIMKYYINWLPIRL